MVSIFVGFLWRADKRNAHNRGYGHFFYLLEEVSVRYGMQKIFNTSLHSSAAISRQDGYGLWNPRQKLPERFRNRARE
jgi:hypothetical protein